MGQTGVRAAMVLSVWVAGCADEQAPERRLIPAGRARDAQVTLAPRDGGAGDALAADGRDAEPPPPDTGPAAADANPPDDAAPPPDATPPDDAAPPPDATPPDDAAPPPDATPPDDVAPPPDATPPPADAAAPCGVACAVPGRDAHVACTVDIAAGRNDCAGTPAAGLVQDATRAFGRLDLAAHAELRVDAEVCGPAQGVLLAIGNSPSNDGFGGDGGDNSYDTEVLVADRRVGVYPGDVARGHGVAVQEWQDWLPALAPGQCTTVTVAYANGRVRFEHAADPAGSRLELVSPHMFQLDEAAGEVEGAPDRLLFLGLDTVSNGRADRGGSGLQRATLTFSTFETRCRTGRLACDSRRCEPDESPEAPDNDVDDDCDGRVD